MEIMHSKSFAMHNEKHVCKISSFQNGQNLRKELKHLSRCLWLGLGRSSCARQVVGATTVACAAWTGGRLSARSWSLIREKWSSCKAAVCMKKRLALCGAPTRACPPDCIFASKPWIFLTSNFFYHFIIFLFHSCLISKFI